MDLERGYYNCFSHVWTWGEVAYIALIVVAFLVAVLGLGYYISRRRRPPYATAGLRLTQASRNGGASV